MSLEPIQKWLLSKGREHPTVAELFNGLCVELNTLGLPVFSASILLQALNCELVSSFYVWRLVGSDETVTNTTDNLVSDKIFQFGDSEVQVFDVAHGNSSEELFVQSPFQLLSDGWSEVRCRLEDSVPEQSFPILDDLRLLGATDYIAVSLKMVLAADGFISFSTRSPGGFSESEIESIRSMRPILAQSFEIHSTRISMENTLAIYLGPTSAQAVLAGRLLRGDIHTLEAVVGFVDIRGFTQSGGLVGNSGLVRRANHFYQCLYDAITPSNGEISKFIGDGALVLFYADGDPVEACERALSSMKKLHELIDDLNDSDLLEHELGYGVALHLGTVEQGNVGAASRMDFTVIGSAVNLASRFEGLSKRLSRRLVVTQAVADCIPPMFEHLGDHNVRGVTDKQAVYGLIDNSEFSVG